MACICNDGLLSVCVSVSVSVSVCVCVCVLKWAPAAVQRRVFSKRRRKLFCVPAGHLEHCRDCLSRSAEKCDCAAGIAFRRDEGAMKAL